MYQIHGLPISSNTTKTIFVAEALGLDYEFIVMDLSKGEHKQTEHMARHPLGKLPTLTHDGGSLFESNAICTYLANVENSSLYPNDNTFDRARIDQWLAFFTNHLGRWLNSYSFEKVARERYGFGKPNIAVQDEAYGFIQEQLPCIEQQLSQSGFFVGNTLTIADYVAFAYFENAVLADVPLNEYPAILAWYEQLKGSDEMQRAYKKLGRV